MVAILLCAGCAFHLAPQTNFGGSRGSRIIKLKSVSKGMAMLASMSLRLCTDQKRYKKGIDVRRQ